MHLRPAGSDSEFHPALEVPAEEVRRLSLLTMKFIMRSNIYE